MNRSAVSALFVTAQRGTARPDAASDSIWKGFEPLARPLLGRLIRSSGGRYWFSRGFNAEALVAWVLGMAAAAAFTNSTRWQSPVSTDVVGGADISIFAGLIVAGVAYYWLCRRRAEVTGVAGELSGMEKA